jgi:hypothetical protein
MKLKISNIDKFLKAYSYLLAGFNKPYDLTIEEKINHAKRNFYFKCLVSFSRQNYLK